MGVIKTKDWEVFFHGYRIGNRTLYSGGCSDYVRAVAVGKDKSLSGSITGGAAESFFGNRKSKAKEKRLSHVTTALSFVFVILVVVMYIVVA